MIPAPHKLLVLGPAGQPLPLAHQDHEWGKGEGPGQGGPQVQGQVEPPHGEGEGPGQGGPQIQGQVEPPHVEGESP